MTEHDFDEFAEVLKAVFDTLGKTPAAKVLTATQQALFFQALADYPLADVRRALSQHIKVGTFTPIPKDIIGYIEDAAGADNRPGAEEAWALALSTLDDTKTVVWTQEAAEAFGKAQPVLDASGAISARKAFIEIYERLVTANRKQRQAPHWFASPGTDQDQRQLAMRAAVRNGQLAAPARLQLEVGLMQAGMEVTRDKPALAPAEQIAEIKRLLLDGQAEKQRLADEAIDSRIEDEDTFKRNLARRVRERQQFINMADQAQVRRAEAGIQQQAGDA